MVYVKHVTPGQGPFWHHRRNLNKLGRGPLGDATYIKALDLVVPDKIFSCFPYIRLCKTFDSWGGGAFLAPGV